MWDGSEQKSCGQKRAVNEVAREVHCIDHDGESVGPEDVWRCAVWSIALLLVVLVFNGYEGGRGVTRLLW